MDSLWSSTASRADSAYLILHSVGAAILWTICLGLSGMHREGSEIIAETSRISYLVCVIVS